MIIVTPIKTMLVIMVVEEDVKHNYRGGRNRVTALSTRLVTDTGRLNGRVLTHFPLMP